MGLPVISRERIAPKGTEQYAEFQKHHCPPPQPGFTPDKVTPDVFMQRTLSVSYKLPLPFSLPTVGNTMPMWVLTDKKTTSFPSIPIRVRQGQVVHVYVYSWKEAHTIHFHGIETTPMNDGVGKHSFEIWGNYTYQWLADMPGTYFYHCHKNTPLHFEMGLYGLLIIDPVEGPGYFSAYNPPTNLIRYDVEAFWVVDELDSRWHKLHHNYAMLKCGADPNDTNTYSKDGILNDFKPDVFCITGAPAKNATTSITDPRAAVQALVGQTVLIRLLNAGYTIQEYTLGVDATVVAADGRSFGVPPFGSYSMPFTIPAGTPFRLTSARRWDLVVRPTKKGVFPFKVDFIDWRGTVKLGTAQTTVTVN